MSNNQEQQQLFKDGPLAEAATALHKTIVDVEPGSPADSTRTAIFDSLPLRKPEPAEQQPDEPEAVVVEDSSITAPEKLNENASSRGMFDCLTSKRAGVVGVFAAAATLFSVGNSDKLSDIQNKPYNEKVELAVKALKQHPMREFKVATLHGTGAASLHIETPYRAKLSKDYRNEGRPRPLRYHEHDAYATATGTASVIAKRGLIAQIVPVHKTGAKPDQGWSMNVVVKPSKIKTEQNDMTAIHNQRTRTPDVWLQRKMNKLLGVEAGRFYGTKTFLDQWAGQVMIDRCADNSQVPAAVPGRVKREITKYIKHTADELAPSNQEQAFILRNLLPLKGVKYANGGQPTVEKELLPGHKFIAEKLHLDSANVTVGVSGYCKP